MSEEQFDYLAHFGVKGMRWGKRKANNDSASSKPKKYSKTEQNRELTVRRADGLSKLAEEFDLDVMVRPRSKGRADFMFESRNQMDAETATRLNNALQTMVSDIDASLVRDGYKKK